MMDLYGGNANDAAPRLTALLVETAIVAAAGWLLLLDGAQTLEAALGWNLGTGDPARGRLLFALISIVYVRMFMTIRRFLRRPMPWSEAWSVSFAFALYFVGFPLLSLPTTAPLDGRDAAFALLFLFGSYLNTYSEWQRDRFKRMPENNGKLYTGGLFRYSMHINYFGDVLWVTALALLTRNPWSLAVPALLFCFFAFFNIPMLDAHLERKYGDAFREYRARTKKFVPFVY